MVRMESTVSIHSPAPSFYHEPDLLWETSDPPSSLSFPRWENLSLNCSNWKDPLTAGPGQSCWGLDSHTVSLSLLYTTPGSEYLSTLSGHISARALLSLEVQYPLPSMAISLCFFYSPALWAPWEKKKNVFVLLIVHLFLYFLQLCQCDSCCYLWGAFFFPTFKISLYNSENHGKFLYWNSKPNQADLISK